MVDFCGQERCGARGLAHGEAGGEEKGGEGEREVFGGGGLGLLLDPATRRATCDPARAEGGRNVERSRAGGRNGHHCATGYRDLSAKSDRGLNGMHKE